MKSKQLMMLKQIITLAVLFTFLVYSKVNAADGGKFRIDDNWTSGFQGQLIIKNETDKPYKNWMVEFDFPYEITSSWGAVLISNKYENYTFGPPAWNKELKPGEQVYIGFIASYEGIKIIEPDNIKLIEIKKNENIYPAINIDGDYIYSVECSEPGKLLEDESVNLKT
ncbi:MAG: hypothetical protein GY756_07460 [bacterium]|nr:hypothetical protein [bacterium]